MYGRAQNSTDRRPGVKPVIHGPDLALIGLGSSLSAYTSPLFGDWVMDMGEMYCPRPPPSGPFQRLQAPHQFTSSSPTEDRALL